MADTAAERVRRSRAHKRGDHSLCRPDRCPDATPELHSRAPVNAVRRRQDLPEAPPDAGVEPGREPGGIEQLTSAFVESLPFPEGDPREILGQLVVELARRVDDDGAVPATVRELRTLLVQLAEIPNQASGQVDELRLKRAQRRLDGLLAQAV